MRLFKLDKNYTVFCESVSNRQGFKHRAILFCNNIPVDYKPATIQYYNRTWERFTFESVIRSVIDNQKDFDAKTKKRLINKLNKFN